ncbi:MAG: antitermination protein NusG [Bacteroidetes bacterium HGW-Bacteroidetes-21]|jgi:transcription antitermination factor NusG|nr:MAG: antitermination protein NusG [Bacteroidetes bacterium HGW-Bacteroidetes-21]
MPWFALYTLSRQEKKASLYLEKQHIVHYLPLVKTLKQWSDRKKWVEEPLFKSYVFIQADFPSQTFYEATKTPGIAYPVRLEGKPHPIPDEVIEAIQQMIENGYRIKLQKIPLKAGTPVEIISGPLMGMRGEVVSGKGKFKFIIKVNTINTALLIDVPQENLSPLHKK